jgi:twinkle protein
VKNAEPSPIKEIIDICDVRREDLSKMENIASSIPQLDKMLGGFYFGQLILLTGERGDGKSTLASQFATAALAQAYSVFFYSGELLDWYFKAWLDYQCAGPKYINATRNGFGDESYSVDGNAITKIERWYKGRLFLYRNESAIEEEHRTLLETIDTAIKQYGCRVLFLDNLMTAMSDDLSRDQYRQQTAFVKQLALMAKQYNVLIFLVAHPRKVYGGQFGNDDVAGSSNITNLVDVVLRYARPADDDIENPPPRILQVLKNRLNGKTHRGKAGIDLYYNEASKRISECLNWSWPLGWETTDGEEPLPF